MTWDFDRYCTEIVTQTTLLSDTIDDADEWIELGSPVSAGACRLDGRHRVVALAARRNGRSPP